MIRYRILYVFSKKMWHDIDKFNLEGQIEKEKGRSEFVKEAHDGAYLPRQPKTQMRNNGEIGATSMVISHFTDPQTQSVSPS